MLESNTTLFSDLPSGLGLSFTPRESGVRIPYRPRGYVKSRISDSKPESGKAGEVKCEKCGAPYHFARFRPCRSSQSHLCVTCRSRKGIAAVHAKFQTPDASRAERIRANGLVNKRVRLGWFIKPTRCMKCDCVPKRIEAHHEDYSQPASVHWLCHRCHWSSHIKRGFLEGIAPFICDDQRTNANALAKIRREFRIMERFPAEREGAR